MFLRSLCRYFPADSLYCDALLSGIYIPNKFSDDVDWINRQVTHIPDEYFRPPTIADDVLGARSLVQWADNVKKANNEAERIAGFIEKQGIDFLWVLAQSPFIIALTRRLCEMTQIPLGLMILDPPDLLMDILGFSDVVQGAVGFELHKLLQRANRCAVVSDSMKTYIQEQFGIPSFAFYMPIQEYIERENKRADNATFTIGFGGYMQFPENLGALVSALNRVDWKVAGRKIKISMHSVGHRSPVEPIKAENIEYNKFVSSEEVMRIFSKIDLGYVPLWIKPNRTEMLGATYSFPTKISLYVSAGCPVFYHGPQLSVGNFFNRYSIGF